ncbi:flagellar hook-basal body protein [Bacillus sp. FJAT-49711]|uniref:flagellar hook-basal body protein n=1 Tax=Bacillus sp. FJAT-49711 TaxID=2833585 RepID=UPI001BC9B2EB|nr:flagellar hook-basal body protein [Bacillus sp. FJAT-49711]MBS4218925.1 flagellar hook-basal body protein [Bacillus sp. FJAT-49711]
MNRSMTTATNTMSQLQKQFDIISNNIANSGTNGFKRKDVSFADMIFQEVNNQTSRDNEIGRLSPHGIRQGVGAKIAKSAMVLSQGAIQNTGRSLDFAFTAENQFLKVRVQDDNGTHMRFTRNGALYAAPSGNNEMMLVTQDGHAVLDQQNNPITFSDKATDFTITNHGEFRANGARVADLGVIALNKPQYMEQKGDSLIGMPDNAAVNPAFVYTDLDSNAIAMQHQALEASNVDLSKEMTDMMNVQRALQFQSRAITVSDQMMGLVNGIR